MTARLRRIALVVALALIVASRIVAAAGQQSTYHKPMAPIGPTSDAQCDALEAEWTAVCQRISAAHQQCLDANADSKIPGAGNCSKAPCLALHRENDSCGGAERNSAISACRASVRAHKDREAAFRAAQEAAQRAAEEAERARRERSAAEAARYRAEEDAARRRKAEYLRNTPRQGARPDLDRRQASLVSDLRSEADRNAARLTEARPLPGAAPEPAGPPPTPPPYEAIDNETLPELSTPLEFIGELADDLGLEKIKHSADVLNWFAKIHDGRRAEAEAARDRFNEIFRRERPNDVDFKYNECPFYPDYCRRVIQGLSPEAQQRFNDYNEKTKRYVSWTDLGNITRHGWSEQEKKNFLRSIGETAGDAIKDKVGDWIAKQNPKPKDVEELEKIEEIVKRNFEKGLDHFFPPLPSPSPRPTTPPAWNLSDEAFAGYQQHVKEWMRQHKMPQRSEPNLLEELLKQMPRTPIYTPAPADTPTVPRG